MILASTLLVAALGQVNPSPAINDPPPCVVARVPGCREGYRLRYDAHGRPFYVYDPGALPDSPPPGAAPSQPPAPAIPPPVYAPRPVYPAPAYAPPPVYGPVPAYRSQQESRLQLGLVWAPAGVTSLSDWDRTWRAEDRYAGLLGVALRGPVSGAELRFSFEFGPLVRVEELSIKYAFNEPGAVRPFLGLGLGAAQLDRDLGLDTRTRAELSLAAGLDFFVTRDFFLTTELKVRGFANRHDAASNTDLAQAVFFFGAGMFL
jgi:hypothetical protein